MLAYKDDTIDANTKGIEFLFKKNKIDWIKGWGSIPEAGKVKVGDEIHEAKNIIVATGSESRSLPGRRGRRERPSSPPPARWSWARSRRRWS